MMRGCSFSAAVSLFVIAARQIWGAVSQSATVETVNTRVRSEGILRCGPTNAIAHRILDLHPRPDRVYIVVAKVELAVGRYTIICWKHCFRCILSREAGSGPGSAGV